MTALHIQPRQVLRRGLAGVQTLAAASDVRRRNGDCGRTRTSKVPRVDVRFTSCARQDSLTNTRFDVDDAFRSRCCWPGRRDRRPARAVSRPRSPGFSGWGWSGARPLSACALGAPAPSGTGCGRRFRSGHLAQRPLPEPMGAAGCGPLQAPWPTGNSLVDDVSRAQRSGRPWRCLSAAVLRTGLEPVDADCRSEPGGADEVDLGDQAPGNLVR